MEMEWQKAYYSTTTPTLMHLLDVLRVSIRNTHPDKWAYLSQIQTERLGRILFLFPINTDEAIGVFVPLLSAVVRHDLQKGHTEWT